MCARPGDELERAKVHFLHLNHTNPLLQTDSSQHARVKKAGMHVARRGDRLAL